MREQVGQHFLDGLGCLVLGPEGEGVVGGNVHDQQEGVVCARDGCEVHQQDVERVVCLGHDRIQAASGMPMSHLECVTCRTRTDKPFHVVSNSGPEQ